MLIYPMHVNCTIHCNSIHEAVQQSEPGYASEGELEDLKSVLVPLISYRC